MDVKNPRGTDAGAGLTSAPSATLGAALHEAARKPAG